MKESKTPEFQDIPTSFSATELSLLWQGIKISIVRQKEIIKDSRPPYTLTYTEHLKRLMGLEEKLKKINREIEKQVVKEIRKL